MQDLIILGNGPHAQEMVEIVERVNLAHPSWNLLGALTAEPVLPGDEWLNGYRVLGTYADIGTYPQAVFVPEFGSNPPALPPARLISLIDPTAFVSRTAQIGLGCVIYPHCFIGLNAVLGDSVFVLSGCVINHDDRLGDRVTLASGVSLAGDVRVEADCYMGQGCTVRQYLRIGRGSLIGMGSVVIRDVPANSVMVGNPARRLRDRH